MEVLFLYFFCSSLLPPIMDRSIKEIVSGIVQRSVSIATQTTKELVLKVTLFNSSYHWTRELPLTKLYIDSLCTTTFMCRTMLWSWMRLEYVMQHT